MSLDIEHQLANSSPGPDDEDEASPATQSNGCWTSVKPIVVKTAKVFCIAVGVTVLMPLVVAVLAYIIATIIAGVAISLVLVPLIYIVIFSFPRKTIWDRMMRRMKGKQLAATGGIGGMYNRARREEPLWTRIMFGSVGLFARASLGALVWLALSLLVPRLKAVTLLGSAMWKWSLLGVTLTAGYFYVLTLVVLLLVFFLHGTTSYYTTSLTFSVNHVVYFGLVLGTWLAYFRTHHGLNHHHHHSAFEYVTWTFVSLFVGSILMLFKNLLLLKWSADSIYRRFEPRILITSLKYYSIGVIAAGFDEKVIVEDLKLLDELSQEGEPHDTIDKLMSNGSVSKFVMSRNMSLTRLGYVCRILISLAEIMSPRLLDHEHEQDDQEEVVTWFKQQINNDTSHTCTPDDLLMLFHNQEGANPPESLSSSSSQKGEVIEPLALSSSSVKWAFKLPSWMRTWKKFMVAISNNGEENPEKKRKRYKEMANVLWRLIGEECSSTQTFTFDHLKIWMVDAHKDCINMGRTLADAKAIVTNLDIFMSFVIFVIVLLLWLLITGVSSTTVLVTVATPFLALTFIFGDSAKTFFQGFMFCFATHPFDVGDRCIIDGVELEVKRVSILTTTFIKIGSKEKRLYPNSILATKAIVNFGWQPDPKDVVELPLSHSTDLDDLKIKITKFFEDESNRYGNTYSLMISEVGENIKVKIHFSHVLTVHDLSHSQCFKKKNSQRSDFLSVIKKHVNETRRERADAKDLSQSVAPHQLP